MRRVTAAALAALLLAACNGAEATPPADEEAGDAATAPSVETTTSTTEAPLVGAPLTIAEQGVTSFPDPYDTSATLGGYGVVLDNPNADLLASGVRVVTRILDAGGTELLVDNVLLNAVMPGQKMALGRTLIEPIVDPTQLHVTVEVTAWLRPASTGTALSAFDVVTEPEPDGGAVTRFTVRSTWPTAEEGVDVTAVYRAADGRLLSAETHTVGSVPANGEVPAQIRLLSPIPDLTSTEVFVGRGIAAQTTG